MATSVLYGRVEYFRQRPNGLQVRIFTVCYPLQRGFPGGSVVKNQSANAGDVRDVGLIPGLGRSPGVGNGNPLQCSCLKIPMDRGALWSTDHGVAKSKTQLIDWEHTHTLLKSWPTPGLDGEVLSGCQAQAGGLWSRIAANDKVLKLGVLSGLEGLPWWLRQERIRLQCWRPTFNPWVGKIPWGRKWQPTPHTCLENSMYRGTWWAVIHGVTRVRHDWATNTLSGLGSHLKSLADGDESHEKYP